MGYQVIIPAAGSGQRMGLAKNKLLVEVLGLPLIAYTLRVFENDNHCEGIILVIKNEELKSFRTIAESQGFKKIKGYVAGGGDRQESVRHGLLHISGDGVVLIHDGARPFVSRELIHRLVEKAKNIGAAIPAVPVKDTIKKVTNDVVQGTLEREYLWAVQTPQAFRLPVILDAHKKAEAAGFIATDDAALVEWAGQKVNVIRGNYRNIKITTPEDLAVAGLYLSQIEGDN